MAKAREKSLVLLLKAPKKQIVNELFVYAYENRKSKTDDHGKEVAKHIEMSEAEGQAVGFLFLLFSMIYSY